MKLSKIAEISGSKISSLKSDVEIKWLLTDSRNLTFPDESIFFAIVTHRNDGHKYVEELYNRGLRYFVVSKNFQDFDKLHDAVFLQVSNTLDALQAVAAAHRSMFNLPVLGITGSNGKTIVKEWLYQLLQYQYNVVRSPRSYNSQIGVPLSVWALNSEAQIGIFEAGISLPGEMIKLEKIILPTIGIFTNLGDAHQENFVSLKQKCEEKLMLFRNTDLLIYNSDNKLIDITVSQSGTKAEKFTWGKGSQTKVRVLTVDKTNDSTYVKIRFATSEFQIKIPFSDDASYENIMHCVALMLYLGFEYDTIASLIAKLEPVAMRLEVKDGMRNCMIINDSYNSDLNSLLIALDFLNRQATVKSLSRTIILSDILQSGHKPADLYASVANLLNQKSIDRIIGIGHNISQFSELFTGVEKSFYDKTEDFLQSFSALDFQNEAILLKGSRNFHFEDISSRIEMLSHETTLEVNLNALVENLNVFRAGLKPETKIMGMVKAFAYGSGSVEVARTLQHHQCNFLAVAVADEGAELRREGIRIPIVVMNPEKASFGMIFENKLEPEIYSFRLLDSFMKAAAQNGITNYPVHIKIDSGMHRLGFEATDIDKLIEILKHQQHVKVRSIFSHLAGADSPTLDYFTHQQAKIFDESSSRLMQAFNHKIFRHLLNSAGAERFPEYQFDMVRLGIGLYGVNANTGFKLKQVCSLKTVILQIKKLPANETVGYNRNGKLAKDTSVAVLPLGYADGFDRHLGNGKGEVFIRGKNVKVIGNVSMDLITVDVTGLDVEEGEQVEIFGNNITISEIAAKLDTIPYEILTAVSRRVKRIYYQE